MITSPNNLSQQARWPIYLVVILSVVALTFSSALNNEFSNWDNDGHLLNNIEVRSLAPQNILKIFSSTVFQTYVPLTTLSFAIEYHFFKFNPFVYHFTNLLLHLFNVALVFFLAQQMGVGVRGASLAALVFGIHPMHVESVVWVTERKDVLYSLFYLLALLSYGSYARFGHHKMFRLSLLFGLLSILSKAMALSLPLVLLLFDWFYKRKFDKALFFEKLSYLAYIIPIVLITYFLNARVPGENAQDALLIWIWSFSFYIQKFAAPFVLLPIYQLPTPVHFLNLSYFWAVIIFCGVLMSFYIFRQKKWVIFALLYYFLSIFFLLRFDNTVDVNIVADRFMYLPSLGFCLLLGIMCEWGLNIRNLKGFIVCAIIVLIFTMGMKTRMQSLLWKDNVSLWTHLLKYDSDQVIALNNRGVSYQSQGQVSLALDDFTHAIALKSNHYRAYNNRGFLYIVLRKYDLAIKDLSQAITIENQFSRSYYNRAICWAALGDDQKALNDYAKAIELQPAYFKAYNNRGNIYKKLQKYPLALKSFTQSVLIYPSFAQGYHNRGVVYRLMNEWDKALADINKALELKPNYPDAYFNRAGIYYGQKKYQRALDDYNNVIDLKPDYILAYQNRALVFQQLGDLKKSHIDTLKVESLLKKSKQK